MEFIGLDHDALAGIAFPCPFRQRAGHRDFLTDRNRAKHFIAQRTFLDGIPANACRPAIGQVDRITRRAGAPIRQSIPDDVCDTRSGFYVMTKVGIADHGGMHDQR